MNVRKGFTLIELLIVVAIIGILAAIAVPNFLNAQVRAKVARVESDLRALSVGIDTYNLDRNSYPPDWIDVGGSVVDSGFIRSMKYLTTPIAYLSDVNLTDPFYDGPDKSVSFPSGGYDVATYRYFCYQHGWGKVVGHVKAGYVVISYGPDRRESYGEWCGIPRGKNWDGIYAPSNGLNSMGDIVRVGGNINPNAWQQSQ
ncbi:MAG: prepilin-type N-terminal cleavage/methylation domain-containing protein [bacterium]|nr:prepilin-type N-terminal cleavage/methylation domain-containing protein [bacterium]